MLEYLVREYLVWGLGIFSPPYLRMIFQEKCFSTYILLTNQISLSDYLYILSWGICALLLFVFLHVKVKIQISLERREILR